MRNALLGVAFVWCSFGCDSAPTSDDIVPMEAVPAGVLEAARKELPGLTFDTVYRIKVDGKDAYEVRGKDRRGKIREVEVSGTGEVLGIE